MSSLLETAQQRNDGAHNAVEHGDVHDEGSSVEASTSEATTTSGQLYDVSMNSDGKNRIQESFPSSRLQYMDSFRGILAVIVVYHHFRCAFYPCAMFGSSVEWISDISACDNSQNPSLLWSSLTNGTLAVASFFIMSGFVLSHNLWKANLETWRITVAKRLIRLAIPCACAVLFSYVMAGWNVHKRAAWVTGSLWLERLGMERPSPVTGLLSQVFLGVWHGNVTLNNSLWTMKFELFGSYLTYLAVIIVKRSSHATRTLCLMAMVLYFAAPASKPVDKLSGRIRYTQKVALPGRPGEKIQWEATQHTVRLDIRKHSHVLRQFQEFATAGNSKLQTVTFNQEEFVTPPAISRTEIVLDQPRSWWDRSNDQVYADLLHAADLGYAGSKEFSPPVIDIVHSKESQSSNPYLWYAAFFFGVWMSERAKSVQTTNGPKQQRNRWPLWSKILLPSLAFVCASYPYTSVMASTSASVWKPMMNFAINVGYHCDHEAHAFYSVIAGMAIMMYLVEATGWCRKLLSNQPYLVLLGKLSFSLYLTHIPILFTFTCQVFLWLYSWKEDALIASLGALVATLPVMLGAALVFWTFVDEPSIQWSQKLARQMLGYRNATSRPTNKGESATANPIERQHNTNGLPVAPNLEVSETSEGSSSSVLS